MSLAKLVLVLTACVAVYFLFVANDLPDKMEFQGHTLGPRTKVENNSLRDFEIYSYADWNNQHVLFFLLPDTQSVSSQELMEFYGASFKAQGFRFRKQDNRHLGLKSDEAIYMTLAPAMNAVVVYAEKDPSPAPKKPSDAKEVFASLAALSVD